MALLRTDIRPLPARLRGELSVLPATVDGALELYVRDPSAPPLTWQGDHEPADALAGVKAILG